MFADVLNMEIEVAEGSELGALGCAICAAVATGRYDGFEAAAAGTVRVGRRFHPDSSAAIVYEAKHAAFCRVDEALNSVWPRFRAARVWTSNYPERKFLSNQFRRTGHMEYRLNRGQCFGISGGAL